MLSEAAAAGLPVDSDKLQLEMLAEYRLRLLAGLKQYYRHRYIEGLLSPQSYKVKACGCVCARERDGDYILRRWQHLF